MTTAGWMNLGGVTLVGAATITAATGRLAITGHGLADGDIVTVDSLTGGGTALRADTPYIVRGPTDDDFQLSTPAGAAPFAFSTDGTCNVYVGVPTYSAVEMRRLGAIALHPASADRLGAREGVRPHSSDPVTVSGASPGTYTVAEGLAVVYPRETSTSAPYVVEYAAETANLNSPDVTNPRLDGIDLQVQDDDEDGSGQRRARIVYVPGTPASSPSAPAVTAGALRLATVLVPANGSPAPSVASLAQYATGATPLPVRTAAERPTQGRYDMMLVARQDTGAIEAWRTGDSAWSVLAAAGGFQLLARAVYTSSTTFDKTAYPGLRAVHVEVQAAGGGGGGTNSTPDTGEGANTAGVSGGGGGGEYRRGWVLDASLSNSTTVTVGTGGSGGSNGSNNGGGGGNSSFGSHVVSNGGTGGESNDIGPAHLVATGGNGGTGGSGGYLAVAGSDGCNGYRAGGAVTGGPHGGGSYLGGARRSAGTTAGANGTAGRAFGGGGSGGYNNPEQGVSRSGGAGAAGVVIVEVYG